MKHIIELGTGIIQKKHPENSNVHKSRFSKLSLIVMTGTRPKREKNLIYTETT